MPMSDFPITRNITYFEMPGKQNTDDVLSLSVARAREANLTHMVVATSSGESALRALELTKDDNIKVVAVTLHVGFSGEGEDRVSEENRHKLTDSGAAVVTGIHALSGLERAFSNRFKGTSRSEVTAEVIRGLFGHGMKVCVECALMAADAGAVPVGPDVEVMALGGRGSGLDTAVILRPSHAKTFFTMEIREIVALPRLKHRRYE